MAGDHLRYVKAGVPLNADILSARTWNAFVDAARAHIADPPAPASIGIRNSADDLVKNTSGADLPNRGIFGIGPPVFTPTDDLDGFKAKFYMTATGVVAASEGKFGVALGPLEDGKLGPAAMDGIVACQVDMQDITHDNAGIVVGDNTKLRSGMGTAQILWSEGGTGIQWAVVRIGTSASPAVATSCLNTGTGGGPSVYQHDYSLGATVRIFMTQDITINRPLNMPVGCAMTFMTKAEPGRSPAWQITWESPEIMTPRNAVFQHSLDFIDVWSLLRFDEDDYLLTHLEGFGS